ncbi:MAG: Crp/Fnr family transcriptional regulator [Elusimicrobia bacterium]|nr:Crp/Fnr family transcriptional regulator [Elusimicrobiota bacterium]
MGYKRAAAPILTCPFEPAQNCGSCDCRRRCFFDFLSPESLREFRARRQMRHCKAHQPLFQEGEQPQGIFILCLGSVKMTKSDRRGRELTMARLADGDLVGEVSFLGHEPYCASAETLSDSVVCFLPRDLMDDLAAREPELERRLLGRVSRFLCRSMNQAFSFAFRSSQSRLADFLLAIRPPPAGVTALPEGGRHVYNRREIARNLGLSPETVIRTLSSFQKRGLIRIQGRAVEVCDRPALEALAHEQ